MVRLMPKRSLFIALVCLLALQCPAQFDTVFAKNGIRRCADSLAHGFRTKDWPLFARYSNPAMIGSMGGTEEFILFLKQSFANLPDSVWKKYAPGKILQVVKTPGELQCVIELNSVLQWQSNRVTSTDYLVGQSWDGGLFWTFFDSQGDPNNARMIKPDLSPEIIIPPKKEKRETLPPAKKPKPKTGARPKSR